MWPCCNMPVCRASCGNLGWNVSQWSGVMKNGRLLMFPILLSIPSSIHPSVHVPSIHTSLHLSVGPPIYTSSHPSVLPSVLTCSCGSAPSDSTFHSCFRCETGAWRDALPCSAHRFYLPKSPLWRLMKHGPLECSLISKRERKELGDDGVSQVFRVSVFFRPRGQSSSDANDFNYSSHLLNNKKKKTLPPSHCLCHTATLLSYPHKVKAHHLHSNAPVTCFPLLLN